MMAPAIPDEGVKAATTMRDGVLIEREVFAKSIPTDEIVENAVKEKKKDLSTAQMMGEYERRDTHNPREGTTPRGKSPWRGVDAPTL